MVTAVFHVWSIAHCIWKRQNHYTQKQNHWIKQKIAEFCPKKFSVGRNPGTRIYNATQNKYYGLLGYDTIYSKKYVGLFMFQRNVLASHFQDQHCRRRQQVHLKLWYLSTKQHGIRFQEHGAMRTSNIKMHMVLKQPISHTRQWMNYTELQ